MSATRITAAARSGQIGKSLAGSLRSAPLTPRDQAAVALAVRLAAAIDEAASIAERLDAVELDVDDDGGRLELAKLRAKVEAQSVLAVLGPRLLAALSALAMTPAARTAKGGDPSDGPVAALAEFRARARARADRPTLVDPSVT